MVSTNFTQKEILISLMEKVDRIEHKLDETREIALATNGKVRLHTKAIIAMSGIIVTVIGWLFNILIK